MYNAIRHIILERCNDITCRVEKSNILNLMNDYKSEYDLANDINKRFSEAFTLSEALPQTFSNNVDCATCEQNNCDISINDILQELDKLNLSKSSPKTDIPTRLYKEAKMILAAPLGNIFNTSILTKTVPKPWKTAKIFSTPKSIPIDIDQLKPMSLLSTPMKLIQKFVLKHNKQTIAITKHRLRTIRLPAATPYNMCFA